MEFPNEIWDQILYYLDLQTLAMITKTNKMMFNYCHNTQFWSNQFKLNGFIIFNNLVTVNEYIKQYKTMLEAKRIVEIIIIMAKIEQSNIKVMFDEDFDANLEIKNMIIPESLRLAMTEQLTYQEVEHYPYDVIISFQENDIQVIYETMDENADGIIKVEKIMPLSEIKRFLIVVQYGNMTTLLENVICDNDELLYYDDGNNDRWDNSRYGHVKYYVNKSLIRQGIRKTLEYYQIK